MSDSNDFYTNLQKIFENPSSASDKQCFTLKKESNKDEWVLTEHFSPLDRDVVNVNESVTHIPQAREQIQKLIAGLKGEIEDSAVYRFYVNTAQSDSSFNSLRKDIVHSFGATPEQIVKLYKKCYTHAFASYGDFLNSARQDKILFRHLFEQGYDYPKTKNLNIDTLARLIKIFGQIDRTLFNAEEIEQMVCTHFHHSTGIENIKEGDLFKVLNMILPQASSHRMDFYEKILRQFRGYESEKVWQDETHHLGYFNVSLPQLLGQYMFSSTEEVDKILNNFTQRCKTYYPQLGLESIDYQWVKKEETSYLRVLLESNNTVPVSIEKLRNMHYQIFDAHTQCNLINTPSAINDVILYHIFSERFLSDNSDTLNIQSIPQLKI